MSPDSNFNLKKGVCGFYVRKHNFAMSPEVGCFLKPHDRVLYEFAGPTVGHLQFSKENTGKHRKKFKRKMKKVTLGCRDDI